MSPIVADLRRYCTWSGITSAECYAVHSVQVM
jgi:hypothetical protein